MPPLRVASLLHTALPKLSPTSRAVLSTLACRNGDAPPASEVAMWVGLQNRYQLARQLRHDGLPPLVQLAAWTRVLYWAHEAELTDASLLRLAHRDHVDPAAAYRLVRRTTGLRWSEVRRAGVVGVLRQLRDRCRMRSATIHPLASKRLSPPISLPADEEAIAVAGSAPVLGPWPAGRTSSRRGALRIARPRGAPALAARVALRGSPFDVAISPNGLACVTQLHAAAVACLRLEPFGVVSSVPTGCVPTRVVFSPSGNQAYVTNQFVDEVAVLDLKAGRQTQAIPVPGDPQGALLSSDGRTLYVTTNIDRLCAISLTAGRVVASVPIPLSCAHLALHPSGERLYVATWKAGAIIEVEARSLRTLRSFKVGGAVQDLAVSCDGLALYAANEQGWLDVIHLNTGRCSASLPLGSPAFGVALSPDDAVLYAGIVGTGRVAVVDRHTLRVTATLVTGGRPRRIAFDPTGRAALVANEAGWVDLIR